MKSVAQDGFRSSLAVLVLLMLLAPAAWGQRVTGSIVGTVTDPSDAVVPGASVTARNVATNLERSATTDAAGFYRIDLLPIGTYAVTVEASGFRREILTDIGLQIDQVARIDVAMQVGELEQEVVVTSAPPLVDTSSAAIGDVIENKRILELPLNGRNFQQLAMLTAGTAAGQEGGTQEFFGTPSGGIGFVVAGGRDDQNNFLIDGINVIDHYFNTLTLTPSIDAVAEFKVLQNSYSTEYGMFGSGQVSVSTKAGTNDIHGSLFEFIRNDKLDARNFFDLRDQPKPPFRQNQFGVSAGGPIKKDRTFFFFAYEGMRVRQGQTNLSALPTADQRNGIFAGTLTDPDPLSPFPFIFDPPGVCTAPCTQIPVQRFGPVANRILADFFPVPNLLPNTPGLNHVSTDTRIEDRDQVVARIDHQFNPNHTFFGRYIWARSDQSFPFGDNILTFDPPPPPGFGTPVPDDSQNVALGLTSVVSSSLINELRVGWNFYDGKRLPENDDVNFATDVLGLPGPQIAQRDRGFPSFSLAGISQFGDSDVFNPLFRKNSVIQFSDNVAWTKGRHSFKFGGDFRFVRFDTLSNFLTRGFDLFQTIPLTGDFLADFLIDRPFVILKLRGDTTGNFRTILGGIYFNDEFRVTPRFTMTYGLRYEVFPPIHERNNRLALYDENTQNIVIAGDTLPPEADVTNPNTLAAQYNALLAGFGLPPVTYVTGASLGLGRSLAKTDWGNYAPRMGIAYDLTGKGNTVLRAAYGIYNALRDWSAGSDSRNIIPFSHTGLLLDLPRIGVPFPLTYDQTYTTIGNLPGGIAFGPQIRMPIGYMQQYTLDLQHQIGQNLSINVGYVGTTGINLNRLTTTNQIHLVGPLAGFRDDPRHGTIVQEASEATSSYHSGFIRVEKRLSQGLMFVSSYTFSKSIDTVSSARENGGAPTREQDAFCLDCEKALSNFDVRQRSVTSFTYELPLGGEAQGAAEKFLKGWQLGGILTFQSGQPFTPQFPGGGDAGDRFQRPSIDCDPNLPSSQRDPSRWFDTSCFYAPRLVPGSFTTFQRGSAGRNILEGPGLANVDFSISKNTNVGERYNFQFRAEFFNAFNHPNFKLPDRNFFHDPVCSFVEEALDLNATCRILPGANMGQVTSAKLPRVIQFGLKFIF